MPERRINFWSSPRNVSTALMYAFARHPDFTVVDEPLYAAYLARFPELDHPGREAILASQSRDAAEVIRNVLLADDYTTPCVLFKQMTHHLEGLDWDFLQGMTNVLLIRDPGAIIASYSKVMRTATLQDVGVGLQRQLMDYLADRDCLAAVVDSRELLMHPEAILRQLCERLEVPFSKAMLSWPAGARPEDGVWAPHWYARVHRSTGFLPYEEKEYDLPAPLDELARKCRPFYEELYARALKA